LTSLFALFGHGITALSGTCSPYRECTSGIIGNGRLILTPENVMVKWAIMGAVFVIAELTVREAIRRRFIFAGLLVSLVFGLIVVFPIHPRQFMMFSPAEVLILTGQMIAVFGGHIAEFFAFLFAVALTAGTISNEVERGVLAVILPKPLARWSVYCGKWLGVNLFVLPFLFFWICLLQLAIYHHTHQLMPTLWKAFFVMALYPLVFTSVTLFFSSFTSNLLAIVMPLILASTAWCEGILKLLGNLFDVATIKWAAKAVVYVAPLNPMSRWVEKVLKPNLLLYMDSFARHPGGTDPPANTIDLAWIIGYGLVAFVAGLIIFQRRDL
jgi:ABC-type transport system involved in multi-copper enzyme maturation permease subunit